MDCRKKWSGNVFFNLGVPQSVWRFCSGTQQNRRSLRPLCPERVLGFRAILKDHKSTEETMVSIPTYNSEKEPDLQHSEITSPWVLTWSSLSLHHYNHWREPGDRAGLADPHLQALLHFPFSSPVVTWKNHWRMAHILGPCTHVGDMGKISWLLALAQLSSVLVTLWGVKSIKNLSLCFSISL